MNRTITVAIVSYSSTALNDIEALLSETDHINVKRVLVANEQTASLTENLSGVDLAVVVLTEEPQRLLPIIDHDSFIVTGPADNADLLRRAFKAGASDYLSAPIDTAELVSAIENARLESLRNKQSESRDLCVFVSPKGGAGASTLVVQLAHILADRNAERDVLAMDLDLQYGNLPLHFDEKPNSRLASVLAARGAVDASVMDACITRPHENLHLLATSADLLMSPWDVDPEAVASLVALASQGYEQVLIDAPRSIDPVTFSVLEQATRICLVVQQTLCDMRLAHHYVRILHDQGIASDTFSLVVNRHQKDATIRVQDFAAAFDGFEIHTLPSDYKRVTHAAEHVVPLIRKWPKADISRNLVALADDLWPIEAPTSARFSLGRLTGRAA